MTAEFKITVLGGGAVGKSALTIRFITGEFEQIYDPTIEDSYSKQVGNDVIHILDTAGQEEFSALQDQWIRDVSKKTKIKLQNQKHSLVEAANIRDKIIRTIDIDPEKGKLPLVLVGNKCDLEHERAVSREEAEEKSKEWKCYWLEASAKEKINIDEVFLECVEQIRKKKPKGPSHNATEAKKPGFCILL
ncbi:Ras GTPase [Reticulomyxa filosa]|uniref:Ras GTPase n=1 Tax=Reticulomyxa filosa TaxID=46433 RepID=X6MJ97_RETFI|nr:Ras GTPase [Reticulomyxa filosa]|eukprot:ETO13909.1 Ras GTPase [Reticulomyxa filosa]